MEDLFISKEYKIRYRVLGQGHCVILLHGYLENMDIWDGFADQLSKSCQVLTLDLPGHGRSEGRVEVSTIEGMAESVRALLTQLNVSKALIVGHSMGGYVSLAFAELFPAIVKGLCLFHSTPNEDSVEKKNGRIQDADLVIKGEKLSVIEKGVPIRFADRNLLYLPLELAMAKEQALKTSDNGVVAALNAMSLRRDRNHVIEMAVYPVMMIFGVHDNLIPLSLAIELEKKHEKAQTIFLKNSGHMGFIEERDQALKAINSFLEYVFR